MVYLSHPLVLHLCDDGVGVSHHGDEEVDEEEGHDGHEQEEQQLQGMQICRELFMQVALKAQLAYLSTFSNKIVFIYQKNKFVF